MNDFPTPEQFEAARVRLLETALDRYLWLQANFSCASLNIGDEFPTRYASFYGLRRSKKQAKEAARSWQEVYFGYLECLRQCQKDQLPTFADALRWLSENLPPLKEGALRPIEASFTSKMLATLDPDRPVLDSEILGHFKLSLPRHNLEREQRLKEAIETFAKLKARLDAILKHPDWPELRHRFDSAFVGKDTQTRITDIKALDLILWASRGGIDAVTTNADG